MNYLKLVPASLICVLTLNAASFVAGDAVAMKHTLTLEGARKAVDAAVAYAQSKGAPGGAIAVVDEGGQLLCFVRLEGTFAGSPPISIGKAKTAMLFRKPTKEFEELINRGRFSMTALPADFTPLQGGVPIKHGDHIVGAIGVSGAMSAAQDEEIAYAGARSVEEPKTVRN